MVNGISAEQAVINGVFASLPDVKSKKEHIMQKGDSLWSIAKQELGEKGLSNREIRDYMLLIAKLNGLDTVEKMNGLMVTQKIYLPDKVNPQDKSDSEPKTPLQKSLQDVVNTLKNDKSVYIQEALFTSKNWGLYHVFREKDSGNGYKMPQCPVLSFKLDKNGKIEDVEFNASEDILPLSYDYKVDKNGKTVLNKYPYKLVENLNSQDKKLLFNEILKLYNEYQNEQK